MSEHMNWVTLLSHKRRHFASDGELAETTDQRHPTSYQEDAERILYSPPFRRLQGKTQVYPFSVVDSTRTRLTHTNEVSYVGRTLANTIAARIRISKSGLVREIERDAKIRFEQVVADVTYAACLSHDLGNPPFGHVGEDAIKSWFRGEFRGANRHEKLESALREVDDKKTRKALDLVWKEIKGQNEKISLAGLDEMTDQQRCDFEYFEGNAQGFRTLTRLASWRHKGGLRLTHAVLGAFSKYPHSSLSEHAKKKRGERKFGFTADDSAFAEYVFDGIGLKKRGEYGFVRHPLAFLAEAADDICYLTTDVEDAFRMKLIEFDEAEDILLGIASKGDWIRKYREIDSDMFRDRIAYLRSGAVSAMIEEVAGRFMDNYDHIMSGSYGRSILEQSGLSDHVKRIRKLYFEKIYYYENKVQAEVAAFTVIGQLLEWFCGMASELYAVNGQEESLSPKSRMLLRVLPPESVKRMGSVPYTNYLVVTDYVAGMTDRYALEMYQRLSGTSAIVGKLT